MANLAGNEPVNVNIEDEMKKSYIDYAMSVIIGRALPDIRDGLKPVHRRILYAMYEMHNLWNQPYRKSARIVGDVIGKYHPHGDAAVYDAIVRMAQDFSLRAPLIDGQGNFGSIDGDPPAAMRYTEIRMSQLAGELLRDINKETVDFVPNYDESLREPTVLPAAFPNLLVNGSSGIAVGMATNIPPHNLTEVIEALIATIRNPEIGLEQLMEIMPGPDFPTAGFITGTQGILKAYRTGRGIIQLRARATVEKNRRTDRESIVVTELPFQANKARVIESIAQLVKERIIEGISDLRDESDREGMRIVIDLRRGEIPEVILNQLYKHTQMQTSFGINLLSIVDGRPRLLNLKEMLSHFIEFRKEVVTRRCRYDLKKAEARAHILEGLKKALKHIDAIVSLIKSSPNPGEARSGLMRRFSLSERQAQAILEMRLQRLTGLEQEKISGEYQELIKEIARLTEILSNEALLLNSIVEELQHISEHYGDERRTQIIGEVSEIKIEDMIAEEDMVVTISHTGYIKRNPISLYRSQHRGGKGKLGMGVKETDFVQHLFIASTHDTLLFFTTAGKAHWLKVHQIPQASRASRGKAVVNLLSLGSSERLTAVLSLKEFHPGHYITLATRKGVVKKVDVMAFSHPRAGGILAIHLDPEDELICANLTDGEQDLFLATRMGMAIRFSESGIRPMGRNARGVRGISLARDDYVVGMEIVRDDRNILVVTEKGYGKRTRASAYRRQSRAGRGLITVRITERNGPVVAVRQVSDDQDLMIVTDKGKIIRLRVKDIPTVGRITQGVKLIDTEADDRVVAAAPLAEKEL
ncbi:MAG: DNA gyrase subunit A [Deltaproteobacteria bacterium]|nr:DNA gyrase subunit A [Deltaproteobacteria bacterium]